MSFSRGEIAGAKKDPKKFLDRLNSRSNRQRTESGSARYFARSAMPLTIATGREVGADIVNTGARDGRPFSVTNFSLGDSVSVEPMISYAGPGIRVAIAHTHPENRAFSGLSGVFSNGKWYSGFSVETDMYMSKAAGVNSYVATPNGTLLGFNLRAMNHDAKSDPSSYLRADDYVSEMP
ncbi:DUF4329 domain-containing protein [Lysobacter gummosus]